jgi:KAP-like P-loop domain-containing protein
VPDWLGRRKSRAPEAPAVTAGEPEGYAGFKVVLDEPAPDPGLGFGEYAAALAEMTLYSQAEFAVGIFGGWGSGKTTFMQAVERRLADDDRVVTVWFNAWRYEKEPHLIIPLLDVLGDALRGKAAEIRAAWAREAAVVVGRASRALLAGLTLSVDAIPGVKIDFDPGKVIEKIGKSESAGPVSFYHAGFTSLWKAIADISDDGANRVVFFVDDLDRCTAASALEVLESMKLLFGVKGCVFVVALDEEIVEKAVDVKYGAAEVSGAEYIKKIFQVPFTLPRTGMSKLPSYLDLIEAGAGFGEAQRNDFRAHVRPHFRYLADEGVINPREIKLLINSYVLQLKVLWARVGDDLDQDVVLALLCMHFRPDWRPFHDQLIAEPQFVQRVLRDAIGSPVTGSAVRLAPGAEPVPPSLLRYLADVARPLLFIEDLRPYLTVTESTWFADPWIPQARAMAARLRRSCEEMPSDLESLVRDGQDLRDFLAGHRERAGSLGGILGDLKATAAEIVASLQEPASLPDAELDVLRTRLTAMFDRLDAGLRDYQRQKRS